MRHTAYSLTRKILNVKTLFYELQGFWPMLVPSPQAALAAEGFWCEAKIKI